MAISEVIVLFLGYGACTASIRAKGCADGRNTAGLGVNKGSGAMTAEEEETQRAWLSITSTLAPALASVPFDVPSVIRLEDPAVSSKTSPKAVKEDSAPSSGT